MWRIENTPSCILKIDGSLYKEVEEGMNVLCTTTVVEVLNANKTLSSNQAAPLGFLILLRV
jgi:hypothetical protein